MELSLSFWVLIMRGTERPADPSASLTLIEAYFNVDFVFLHILMITQFRRESMSDSQNSCFLKVYVVYCLISRTI